MPISSEIEKEILQRAERRKKELLEALSGGVITSNTLSADEATVGKDWDGPLPRIDIKRKPVSSGDSETSVTPHGMSDLLYQAKPARSVYNSPLIKANRAPLWKSPPPFANQFAPTAPSFSTISEKQTIASKVSMFESPPSVAPSKANSMTKNLINSPLSHIRNHRLYPSLSRTDCNGASKSPQEKKEIKENSNRSTASAMKTSANLAQRAQSNCKNSDGSMESKSAITNSIASLDVTSENDIEDTYDMDRFLEEALGSALNLNSTMTDEKDENALAEESFCASEVCKTPVNIHNCSTLRSSMRLVKLNSLNEESTDRVNRLLQQADMQQQLMGQASKALTICRSSKIFFNSASLVDAERLLLLATLRHKAVLDEIKGTLPLTGCTPDVKGRLCVLEVSVPLKDDPLKWSKTEHERDLWFLCVLCHGQQVLASGAVGYESEAKCITFSGTMALLDLPDSFSASLEIYSLRTCRPLAPSHRSKMSKACQLLRRKSKSCIGPSGSSEHLLHLRTPAFALSGSVCLDLTSLVPSKEPQHFRLEKVPLMSPLRGSAWIRTETALTCSIQICGFLTVLEKVGGSHAWQRRYCLLQDLCLNFWNYPADQDVKKPLDVIDLRACSSGKVEVAPRHLCARSRTLMLEAIRSSSPNDLNSTLMECNTGFTLVRYFLSCDSVQELNEWSGVLDQVLSAIKMWHINMKHE